MALAWSSLTVNEWASMSVDDWAALLLDPARLHVVEAVAIYQPGAAAAGIHAAGGEVSAVFTPGAEAGGVSPT